MTNRVFRDTNAWYNIVFTIDRSLSTADDRIKLYINGVQETSFSARTNPSQQTSGSHTGVSFNASNYRKYLGGRGDSTANYFNGSLSHVHWTDGYAYSSSTFGSTDATTGEWKINTSPSITMGINGFTTLKDGNTITDQSTNNHNFSLDNGTLTKTEDCPSNVFATLNPLIPDTTAYTYSNGNNTVSQSGGTSYWKKTCSTLGMTKGKWYWEAKYVSGNYIVIGVGNTTTATAASGMPANGIGYKRNGDVQRQGAVTVLASYAHGDIISCYLDMDNEALYLSLIHI